ncbi:hypothetical protein CMV_024263 [Castanea mollissima]|nr:hypothetical protein CMV_024263 [Castanea mollissima]
MVTNTPKTEMEKALDGQMKSRIHGQELTSLNIDKTQLLESLLIKDYGGSEDVLLGELQFAFIAFLFIKVIYYQLKFGLEKDLTDTSGAATGVSALLNDSWLFADSFCTIFARYLSEMPHLLMDIYCRG